MPSSIQITLEELHGLEKRIEQERLEKKDWPLIQTLVSNLLHREEGKVARLAAKIAAQFCEASQSAATSAASFPAPILPEEPKKEPAKAGHGRNGAGVFTAAKHFSLPLFSGVVGSLCEKCRHCRLKRYREKQVIRVVGQPLFSAEIYAAEQARCPGCGHRVSAALPKGVEEGIGKSVIYHWSAAALLLVLHYTHGLPFKRLEGLHSAWGIPFADANQWEIAAAAVAFLKPLLQNLEKHGIEHAENLKIDDTGTMVLETKREIEKELEAAKAAGEPESSVRAGINATCLRLETKEGPVILYFTGRHHAGEVLDRILGSRSSELEPIIKVSDGASKNFSHGQAEKLIEATCHAHAFLKFRALKESFPDEYKIVGEAYGKIFENDTETRARAMTPEERLHYHQAHSKPWLEKIHALCATKLDSRLVEPRSPLWEPVHYFLNQWPRLTKFLEVPGVPLDTNLVEQNLIIPVRYLAASFNYKTRNGSGVGDAAMTLVQSAHGARVEPVAYLAYCLEHHEDLARNPAKYLPWAYRDIVKTASARDGPVPRSA